MTAEGGADDRGAVRPILESVDGGVDADHAAALLYKVQERLSRFFGNREMRGAVQDDGVIVREYLRIQGLVVAGEVGRESTGLPSEGLEGGVCRGNPGFVEDRVGAPED